MPVTVIKSDLSHILAQIKIAEAHAAGQPLIGPGGLVPAYNISYGLRTTDGSYNNLLPGQERWGASDQPFPTLLDPVFRDGQPMPDMDGPGPMEGGAPTSYTPSNDLNSVVIDSSLRTISNLIVDQTMSNPAAVQIYLDSGRGVMVGTVLHHANADGTPGLEVAPTDTLFIPNVSPDVGLSASFNSWFTLFGQFFDHGLDLVNKGGSGTVFIPLQPDDPLYVEGSPTNFMALTRATVSAGPDGVMNTPDDVRPVNTTTAFVDQNQTYTSHSSHQVFLRDYALVAGRPVATGKLIEGENGGMANWAEVKAQARTLLGIDLKDSDVGSVPLLRTDQYGNFIPGPNGFPQVIVGIGADGIPNTADDLVVSGTPGTPVDLGAVGALRTAHAFLADIAHTAVPNGLADGDIEVGLDNLGDPTPAYDNELLDQHFIAGDGRVNENIGLTTVHHVFHAEHNRMVDHQKNVILESADLAFLNEWLRVDVGALPTTQAQIDALQWDGTRLFQAAKFTTEMQYQHLVFEEFARKIQPSINVFLVPDGFDPTINPNIVAEFAHVVYRFGHSMLTQTIDRFDENFTDGHIDLVAGFLNPGVYDADGTLTDEVAAGSIIRGMTRQVGNEIDEFVTGTLRNNLLGLPLDLATINLARGRDTGVPSLNDARREFYAATNNAAELRPYESWVDFASNLKHEASIINFIAAYGKHSLITDESSVVGKRAAALAIVLGTDQEFTDPATNTTRTIVVPEDRLDFLNGTGVFWGGADLRTNTGLEEVDLWIGGLAEKIMPFGGMLGSTFNFVFEQQMESLQNGDRFYYLQRLDGLHLFGEMEGNSFAEMMMTHSNATHLPSDVFSTPGLILEVDETRQYNDLDGDGDMEQFDPAGGGILTPLVVRNNPSTPGSDENYLRYTGDQHVVLGGTPGADVIVSSEGDDTLYGDGGNDTLEGGAGNDIINGGAGDDVIRDLGGDDNIKGNDGNDVIHAGPGADLVMGGAGKDFILLGNDPFGEVFGGTGDDFILGNKNAERILGNEGNDWLETGTFDGAPGDNFDEIFAKDDVDGHDVFLGDGGFDEFIAEGGDDIMVGSLGRGKMVGMSGFDWATYKDSTAGVNVDFYRLAFDEPPLPPANSNLESYESVEGMSGSAYNDLLLGSDADAVELAASGFRGSVLTAAGIARIAGLQDLLGAGVTSFDGGDIILGGDGNDTITGRGGNDIIDGDKWLNVRISVRANPDGTGAEIGSHTSMKTLVNAMMAGTINPGQLVIVREILTANGTGDIDTAIYAGNMADYTVVRSGAVTTVTDDNGVEGTDTLRNIERIQFADGVMNLSAIMGTAGPDNLTGTAGDDVIMGLAGNDTLTGGLGNDALDGGADNDTASYADATGAVTVSLAIAGPQNTGVMGTDTLTSIENLVGGIFNDTLTAAVGANSLNGGGGNDTLVAVVDGVRDTMEGGAGVDTADYSSHTAGLTLSLTGTSVVTGSGGSAATSDTISGFENFTGGSGNDSITASGTNAASVANVLLGGAGNDTLIATVDNLRDTFDGGTHTTGDTANFGAYTANLTVNLGGGAPIVVGGTGNSGANSDVLVGIEHFVGGSGNDSITGSGSAAAGVANNLTGGGGNDTLIVTVDNVRDVLDGGAGSGDTANYAAYGVALTANLTGTSVVGGSGNTGNNSDTTTGIEHFIGGSGNDSITGSGTAGTGVANTLTGGAGDDTLIVTVDNVRDTLDGGVGTNDTANFGAYTVALTVNLGAVAPILVGGSGSALATQDVLVGIESFTGGTVGDNITGSTGANTLSGGGGNDTMNGGDGADILNGDAGNDVLNGGTGADLYVGGAGADSISASVGDDNIRDIIRFTATTDFGDTVTNFDANGTDAPDDRVEFAGALRALYDDGTSDGVFTYAVGNQVAGEVSGFTIGEANGNVEALYLSGSTIAESVLNVEIGNAAAVALAFNNEFALGGTANGQDAILIVNDRGANQNNFSVWQWVQAGGGEITVAELTLIGVFNGNGTGAVGNFGFGPG